MADIEFRSDFTVELEGYMGSDAQIANVARVSTQGMGMSCHPEFTKKDRGLLNMLMRDRHGCYDSDTEVLTRNGWIPWPSVDGSEEFLTYNLNTHKQEYQRATNVIHKSVDENLVRISNREIDLLVTEDHRMVAQLACDKPSQDWGIVKARDFFNHSYRIPAALTGWFGEETISESWAEFVGFFVGDGHLGTSATFHLKRPDKISYLRQLAHDCGFAMGDAGNESRNTYTPQLGGTIMREILLRCYENNDKVVPEEIRNGTPEIITSFFRGYHRADGHLTDKGTYSSSTVSTKLSDHLQELAVKIGVPVYTREETNRDGAFGNSPLHITRYKSPKFVSPRIGWTQDRRRKEVTLERYTGEVHCVTVPNGTLCVRRNGKVSWCGNTPWESGILQFYIEAPIFVTREFFRHRIASYNETSSRYREMEPVFYVPGSLRPLQQIGKPGAYTFEPGTYNQGETTRVSHKHAATNAWCTYEDMLEQGVAREVARNVLPLSLYSSFYVTLNLRSLFNFLSLRRVTEDTTVPTFPLWEIDRVAGKMEELASEYFPVAFEVFNKHGRVAP